MRSDNEEKRHGGEKNQNQGELLTTKSFGLMATTPLRISSALTQSPWADAMRAAFIFIRFLCLCVILPPRPPDPWL